MAVMNPVLHLRRAFRTMGGSDALTDAEADEAADEAADAMGEYGYSRRESDLRFERMMAELRQQTAEMRQAMAEMRTQLLLAIMVATGLIIGAVGLLVAFLD